MHSAFVRNAIVSELKMFPILTVYFHASKTVTIDHKSIKRFPLSMSGHHVNFAEFLFRKCKLQIQIPNSDSNFMQQSLSARVRHRILLIIIANEFRVWFPWKHHFHIIWAIWHGPYLMVSSFYTPGKYISILNLLDTSSGWLTNHHSRTLHMVNPKISRAILVMTP